METMNVNNNYNYNSESSVQGKSSNRSDAVSEFMKFMELDTGEKFYELVLREMGLTKEDLEKLPPDERMKIEQKIRDRIKEKVERGIAKS